MAMVRHHPSLNRPERPVCSVCIANYSGAGLLADCLDSVFAQQCDFSFEVIVHDDASTDDSVSFLRECYPQVELLVGEVNVGFCISNNRMAEHARGDYLLLLNNDAALLPGALSALHAATVLRQAQGILTLPQYDWTTSELVDRGCMLDPFYNPVPNLAPGRRDVAMVIGACMWIPRALWRRLDGFPEWIGSIGEDLYLCGRARLLSFPVETLDESGYRHRQGSSFGGNRVSAGGLDTTVRRRRLSERNKTLILAMLTPSWLMYPLLATHMLLLAFEGLLIASLRLDPRLFADIYGHALLAPVRQFALLSSTRRAVQGQRTLSVAAYFRTFVAHPRKLAMLVRYGLPRIRR